MVTWSDLKMPSIKLSDPLKIDCSNASSLAVVIGNPIKESPLQFHVGLLYRFGDNHYFLHLGWHNCLLNQDVSKVGEGYYWVDCGLSEEEKQQLALQCYRVFQKNGHDIPYGLDPKSCHFDSLTHKLVLDKSYGGLTCATFVLELFESAALPLIVKDGWPQRKRKTKAWQLDMIKKLEGHASAEHLEAQRLTVNRGCMRFPPHEVAAAVSRSPHPQKFAWISTDSLYIRDVLIGKKVA